MPLPRWTAHSDLFTFKHGPDPEDMPWLDERWFEARGIGADPFNAAYALVERHLAEPHAGRAALIGDDEIVSFAELASRVGRLATVLAHDYGIRPGNRVFIWMRNSPWWAAAFFAVLRTGGVAVLCSPLFTANEVAAVIDQTAPSLVLYDDTIAVAARQNFSVKQAGVEAIAANLPSGSDNGTWTWTAPTDPAVLLFTSGSTGKPKACIHFHRDLVVAADTFGHHVVPVRCGDVVAGSPFLAFAYGLEVLLLTPLRFGAAAVLTREQGMLPLLLSLRRWAVTHVYTNPAIYRSLLECVGRADVETVKACVSAGENPSASLISQWRERTGLSISNGLGSSEINAFLTGSSPGDAPDGSAGRVVPGFSIRIIGDDGADLPTGTPGRLAMRGPTGCRYLGSPLEQRARVVGGWTLMGDRFEQDASGYLWSHGRSDDLIVKGGINIAPVEVENVITAAAAVRECAVVGVFRPELQTELIYAYVVLDDAPPTDETARALRLWASSRIAINKVPDKIIFCTALPRNSNGKVQRFVLREEGIHSS